MASRKRRRIEIEEPEEDAKTESTEAGSDLIDGLPECRIGSIEPRSKMTADPVFDACIRKRDVLYRKRPPNSPPFVELDQMYHFKEGQFLNMVKDVLLSPPGASSMDCKNFHNELKKTHESRIDCVSWILPVRSLAVIVCDYVKTTHALAIGNFTYGTDTVQTR